MMEARDVSVAVGRGAARKVLLDCVSFSASSGEIVAIIGRNGAGKSTLCSCAAGIRDSYTGSVAIDGRDIRTMTPRERARAVAYVPQSTPEGPPYTAREFAEMSRYPWRGVASRSEDERAVREALALAGVEELAERRLSSLSGGERQRCMIAAAAAQCAGCVILDEPTAFLDYRARYDAALAMAALRERGAVVVVTHDIDLALSISTRIVALAHGKAIWSGTPDALATNDLDELERIFDVPFRRFRAPDGSTSVLPASPHIG